MWRDLGKKKNNQMRNAPVKKGVKVSKNAQKLVKMNKNACFLVRCLLLVVRCSLFDACGL